MRTHKDLDVWKLAMELTANVYCLTDTFPKHERYGLSSQLCRAAISVASNIAEGAARGSKKEFIRFLYCSLGSSAELETQLELVKMLNIGDVEQLPALNEKQARISQMLLGLIKSLRPK